MKEKERKRKKRGRLRVRGRSVRNAAIGRQVCSWTDQNQTRQDKDRIWRASEKKVRLMGTRL